MRLNARQQLAVPLLLLVHRHVPGALDGLGNTVGVFGLTRRASFSCSAASAKRDSTSTPGSWLLRGDELFGYQVHAIAQRGDQAHAGGAAQFRGWVGRFG